MSSAARHSGSSPPRNPPFENSGDVEGAPVRAARILVVEDEFLIAMSMEADLEEGGYTIAGTAHSADDAVAIAKAARPDLVVMDIRLLGKRDGIDAALEIYRTLGIRCIFATAHGDAETMKRAGPAEPLGWLHKPYGRDGLLAVVENALERLKQDSQK